jgi:hypothetical protein
VEGQGVGFSIKVKIRTFKEKYPEAQPDMLYQENNTEKKIRNQREIIH